MTGRTEPLVIRITRNFDWLRSGEEYVAHEKKDGRYLVAPDIASTTWVPFEYAVEVPNMWERL